MSRRLLPPAVLLALACAAPAAAAHPHVVGPGETLWGIAAANNFTTRALAAYNGLPEDGQVVLGSTIQIPSEAEAADRMRSLGLLPPAGSPAAPASAAAPAAATVPATPAAAPPPLGGYVVRPGDTLSGLAAQSRVTVAAMAAMNGLDPDGLLLAGTVLKLPTGAAPPAAAAAPAPAARVVPPAAPAPTATRLDAATVGSIAAQHGVPSSLAAAIGWQESGFNNAMVSVANARGIMQVMPGTWDWVQQNLADRPLDPASATDNVAAGSLYLGRLLRETGGDERLAIAGYYQGLASVRRIGLLPETERYVANVQALRARFGG